MANKRHIRLNSARDAHKLLSKMINERRRNEIDGQECRDVGYLLRILLDFFKAVELEDRIENLEKPQEIDLFTYPQHSVEDERTIIRHYQNEHKRTLAAIEARKAEVKAEVVTVIPTVEEN